MNEKQRKQRLLAVIYLCRVAEDACGRTSYRIQAALEAVLDGNLSAAYDAAFEAADTVATPGFAALGIIVWLKKALGDKVAVVAEGIETSEN